MKELYDTVDTAIYKLNNNIKPVFNPLKWDLTGEVILKINEDNHTEIVESKCGTWVADGCVSCGELIGIEEIEFK